MTDTLLSKFQKLGKRNKPLYKKANAFISGLNQVLKSQNIDQSATSYFGAIAEVIKAPNRKVDPVVLAYCFAAVLSQLSIAVIQHQQNQIFQLISALVGSPAASEHTCRYGVIALQFLLHAKIEAQWQPGKCSQTKAAVQLMLSFLLDSKREKAQKQAIKSVCLMLQNKKVLQMPLLTQSIQALIQETISGEEISQASYQHRQQSLLQFLAAALQVMPEEACCDTATKIATFVEGSTSDKVKIQCYLTIEVLYASRRLSAFGDHITTYLRNLLNSPEIPEQYTHIQQQTRQNMDQRCVAYIQAVSQITLNLASMKTPDQYWRNEILRYLNMAFSVFSEYLVAQTERVQRAASSALRIVIQNALTPALFEQTKGGIENDINNAILSLDALTISEEVENMRADRRSKNRQFSAQEKLLINVCHLLSTRYQPQYDLVLKLVAVLIQKIGPVLLHQQQADLLNVVATLEINSKQYLEWHDCLGAFLQVMGPTKFFEVLPLRVLQTDLGSLTFAQDSRSYLIQIMHRHLKKGDLVFFLQYFQPQISQLLQLKKQHENPREPNFSLIKAKKYETLAIQIWECLPIFCRSNSSQLSEAVQSLLTHLEPMVNKNSLGLRTLALRSLSSLITHCKTTPVVDEQIKKTRIGLQRIAVDYVEGLSRLYTNPGFDEEGKPIYLPAEEQNQILQTLQDFSSVTKSVKLTNLFLESFVQANQLCKLASTSQQKEQILLQLDVLFAMMTHVKLNRENKVSLMAGVKDFVNDHATQKKGYKILTRVIESFQLETLEELAEIKNEITPLMKGQVTKQRLYLIKAYIKSMFQFKDQDKEITLPKILEIVRSMAIELITTINNSNLKVRKLAEEAFLDINELLKNFKANAQLLQCLLVGIAGTTPQMQSSTIRALIFVFKHLLVTKKCLDDSKLLATDQNVQDFVRKVTKIVALFLKDKSAPKELHRSALKFLKVAITYLQFAEEGNELCTLILTHCFAVSNPRLHTIVMRRIIGKLIARCGLSQVQKATTKEHLPLVQSVERQRRKKANQKERAKMLALLGKKVEEDAKDKNSDSDSESSDDAQMNEAQAESDSESDSDEEQETRGVDTLASSNKFDIPIAHDIPVLSHLAAKSKEKSGQKAPKGLQEQMEVEDLEFETHFVENPFIKTRERASKKQLDAQQMLQAGQLEMDTDKIDILRMDEGGKIMIRDLEQTEREAQERKTKKRTRADVVGYGNGDDVDSEIEEEEMRVMQKQIRDSRSRKVQEPVKRGQSPAPLRKRDAKAAKHAQGGGHTVKASGDQYKSTKGKGDVLKSGTHEPYAYIKLNPEMLNPKKKNQAVASFAGVVSHGKKVDKRTMKRKEGMMAGLSAKQ